MTPHDKTLEALRESEFNYGQLFEAAADALILFVPADGRIHDVNGAAVRQYGWTREELLARCVKDLSAEAVETAAALRELVWDDSHFISRRRHRRKDGSEFIAEIRASALVIKGRRWILSAVRDITEQVRAGEKLAESELLMRQMAESISQVFWMTDLEKNRMIYISPAYEAIWGRTCESLYRDPRSWLEAIVPEDRERVLESATTRQLTGRYDETYRIRRSDGTERWIRDRAFVVRGEKGGVVRVTGVAEDVTEQKRTEEALTESRAFLEKAQEVASIGSWTFEIGTDRVIWSPESWRIFGLEPRPEMDAAYFFAAVHVDDRERVEQHMAAALAGGRFDVEYRILRSDDKIRWVHAQADILRDPAGKPAKVVGIVQDVTERLESARKLQETQSQLLQAQKMEAIGRLAGGVAHDFNNLLTVIMGLSETTLAALPKDGVLFKDIEEIRDTGQRAANLTQQLLAFSRRQVIAPRPIDLNDVLLNAAKMLRRVIGEDVELSVSPGSQPVPVKADPGQLEQLIMNLAVNARDAMPEGGRLSVETSVVRLGAGAEARRLELEPGDYARLTVADTGEGMTEYVRAHLFEPFFTTKALGRGTGLGLATCYGIVKQNGGAIDCDSAPGRGASFRVLLPLLADVAAGKGVEDDAEAVPPGGRERVLIVEDESSVRSLIARQLRRLGYDVTAVCDGEEGLAAVRADAGRRLRLIVSDMVMPRLGGLKLAQAVAAVRPDLKVLLITGYTDDAIGDLPSLAPGDELLHKPFTLRELADKVRRVLDGPPPRA